MAEKPVDVLINQFNSRHGLRVTDYNDEYKNIYTRKIQFFATRK